MARYQSVRLRRGDSRHPAPPMLIRGLVACGLAVGGPAAAVGLGDLTLRSALGEPFDAVVQLVGTPQAIAPHCVATGRAPAGAADDIPVLGDLRIETVRGESGTTRQIVLRSRLPVSEPLVRVIVHLGCGVSLTRDYVVLPSPRNYPVGVESAEVALPSGMASAPETVGAPPASGPGRAPGEPADAVAPVAARTAALAEAPPAPRAAGRTARPEVPDAAPKPPRPAAADSVRISPTAAGRPVPVLPPPQGPAPKAGVVTLATALKEIQTLRQQVESDNERRQQDKEAYANLEIQLVSLRRQIEELKLRTAEKEATEKRLADELAAARVAPRGLFRAIGESPGEAIVVVLFLIGVGAASAYASYRTFLRQVRSGGAPGDWPDLR